MEHQSGPGSEPSIQEATIFMDSLNAPFKEQDERQLLRLVCHSDPDIRDRADDELCQFGSEYSLLAARCAISDENEFVRNTAMEIIGEIGNAQDLRRVSHGLHDESWLVRASAASAMGAIGSQGNHRHVARELIFVIENDTVPHVRRYAIVAYSTIMKSNALRLLNRRRRMETDVLALCGVYSSLYRLGVKSALKELITVVMSGSVPEALVAINCLSDVDPEDFHTVIEALKRGIKHRRHRAVIGDARAIIEKLQAQAREWPPNETP